MFPSPRHLNLFVSDRDALHCSPGTSSSPAPAPFHLTLPPALGAGAAVAPSPTTMPAQTYPARSAVFGLHVTLDDGDTVRSTRRRHTANDVR